ncbi:MAG: KH domain-containing protein [bacterium]
MKELVEYLVKNLVDEPDKIRIEENSSGSKTEIHIHAAQADRGKIIGKTGRIIKAIRTLANASVSKQHTRSYIELKDDPD